MRSEHQSFLPAITSFTNGICVDVVESVTKAFQRASKSMVAAMEPHAALGPFKVKLVSGFDASGNHRIFRCLDSLELMSNHIIFGGWQVGILLKI